MEHDYDEYYDTKVSRPFAKSKIGLVFGISLFITGLAELVVNVNDLYLSQYNLGNTQTNENNVYTWDENPFWPSYGKGFWVGLILMATGISGVVAFLEHTIASIYAFAALCTTSAIFSFYLLITASIPLAKYTEIGGISAVLATLGEAYANSAAFNAVLLTLGGVGFILASVAGILSCLLVGCCTESRGYGGVFLENYYKSLATDSSIPSASSSKII